MSKLVAESLRLLAEKKEVVASAIENIFNTKSMATLKISGLSVGDWVRYGGIDYQVKSIDGAFERVTLIGNKEQRDESIYALHPIPITAEILEKNGWCADRMYATLRIDEHIHLVYYYHEHRLRKYYCGVDEWQNHQVVNDITMQCHCWYIHQLQHALRLAGVDKGINL